MSEEAKEPEVADLDVQVPDYEKQADPVAEFTNYGWLEIRRFLKTISAFSPVWM